MSRYRSEFTSREQQVAKALYLALVAPEEHIREACLLLAEQIAVGLDASTVAQCEAAARERFQSDSAG